MACTGAIQFIDIPFGRVDWINNIWFDEVRETALIANVARFRSCSMELDGDCYALFDIFKVKRGWIRYDVKGGTELCITKCVVVGRMEKNGGEEYYVIVVVPTSVDGEYRRIGVGIVRNSCVVRERVGVRIV